MSRLTYLNESRETTELTQFEGDSWEELIKNADTVDQIFMHNAIDKLYEYEDLEEQGLLLKLPCKVGDIIYDISTFYILSYKVESFKMLGNRVGAMRTSYIVNDTRLFSKSYVSEIGKTVFLTKEEAEKELKRLERGGIDGI